MRSETSISFPSVLTLGNLLCGFLSLIYSISDEFILAAWLIVLAAFLDAADGRLARLTGSNSRFGMELDSLADLSSFGLVTSLLLYRYSLSSAGIWGLAVAFVFFTCGALRLARYNVLSASARRERYIGLPVPVTAVTLVSYTLFFPSVLGRDAPLWVTVFLVLALSALMVSSIEYERVPDFRLGSFWEKFKVAFCVAGTALLVVFPSRSLFPLSLFYVSSGLVRRVSLFLRGGAKNEV